MAAEKQEVVEKKTSESVEEKESPKSALAEEALRSASTGAASSVSEMAKSVGKAAADALPSMSIQDGARNEKHDGINNIHDDKKIGDAIKNITDKNGNELHDQLKDFFKPKDGVEKLPTGDFIVRDDGKQTLFTPNGDSIAINPDGSNTIKGDVNKVSTDKYGETSVEFKDGSKVSFDENGFTSIQRDGQGIHFGRIFHQWGGGIMNGAKVLNNAIEHGGGGMMQMDKNAIKQGLEATGKALKGN